MFKKISSLSKREKFFLYITILIVIIGVICNFLIFPVLKKWRDNKKAIKNQEIKLKKSYSLLNRAKYIENWNKKLPFDLETSEVKESKITQILSHIETISKKTSVQIVNIVPGDIKESGDYKLAFVQLVVKGDIRDMVKFLYRLESSPMVFTIENLEMEVDRVDSNNMKVSLEISKLIII